MFKAIGIDIGGTKISGAFIENGEIISEIIVEKTPFDTQLILKIIFGIIETLLEKFEPDAIAIATAGAVNNENSKVIGSTGNLPADYSTIEFKKVLEDKYKIRTLIENDANAAAFAEYKIGAAKGTKHSITITLGTGVGGGIIVNGALLKGKSGAAGELGHIVMGIENNRDCTCGFYNCFEAYASGTGLKKTLIEMAKTDESFSQSCLKTININDLTTYNLIDGLKNNDKFCTKAFELWEKEIEIGIISLANVFDPEIVVLSGGMAKFVDTKKIEEFVNNKIVTSDIKVVLANTGNYAGMIGAALLASEKFKN